MPSSELEFDFDDIIVNSAAYRRALAAAKQQASAPDVEVVDGDLIDFSDNDTLKQVPGGVTPDDVMAIISEDLLGLQFSANVCMLTSQSPAGSASVFNEF